MKSWTYAIFALLLLALFPAGAFAARNSSSLKIYDHVTLAKTQLAPGQYKVEWSGAGSQVQVTILRDNKQVASAPARLVDKPSPYEGPAMITVSGKDGQRKVTEIEFSNVALIFQPASPAPNKTTAH